MRSILPLRVLFRKVNNMHNFGVVMFMGLLLVVDIVSYKTALDQWSSFSPVLLILAFVISVIIVAFGYVVLFYTEKTDESFNKFVKELKVK